MKAERINCRKRDILVQRPKTGIEELDVLGTTGSLLQHRHTEQCQVGKCQTEEVDFIPIQRNKNEVIETEWSNVIHFSALTSRNNNCGHQRVWG